ncbi:hypothetical protein KP509_19G001900 [Ceratopteris richardii]|uniref:RCC1-like domain-containing protein n=1 Tax=Ceratopteris richardii TaxID=49495 RepID=A0A8T2SJK3_CERRI|nr:hypothetical protein KP509_19G001900 [Ceratopteris richardii]
MLQDSESGWSSLHRALHFGHLAVAGVLIEAGANLLTEDSKGRTPIDLISGPVKQVMGDPNNAGGTEVFSWGNGANYQLGTGSTGIQKLPCRLDALQGLDITAISAAKFHSMAATADGKLYSWGFGRGGRLGFSDFDIHSGQVAVISPQLVSCGIINRKIKVVAAAKHHSLVVTEGGEVFTWGSNREGQLGYTSVDTQATPRRVTTLKVRVVAAALANKHSAVLTEAGEVFTWGCNREGQLGYGTSNSASNPVPRVVEYVKGKNFSAVSAAKYHTVVLGSEGEVFTWGYKLVMPRRVPITRNTRKAGHGVLKFHQAERLHIVAIAAGLTHTTAISKDGLIFYWFSADPNARAHQLMLLAGHQASAVAAGKYRTAVVTISGDIYAWDGESAKEETLPIPHRVHGIKHATLISVGENHSLAVTSVYMPKFQVGGSEELCTQAEKGLEDYEEDMDFEVVGITSSESKPECDLLRLPREPPTLKELCENVISQCVVEPKNALQLLEIADSLEASKLRKHCEDLALHNLDYILTMSPTAFANVTTALLADLEKALDSTSLQLWSYHRLPTPTALFPAVVDSEEDDCNSNFLSRMRSLSSSELNSVSVERESEGLFNQECGMNHAVLKQLRALKKKLQQIEALEVRQSKGHVLDHQQIAKLETKAAVRDAILALDPGTVLPSGSREAELQFTIDSNMVGIQEKEIANKQKHGSRRKCKTVGELAPVESHRKILEPQKKSRKGQATKAGTQNLEASIVGADADPLERGMPRLEKEVDEHKSPASICLNDNQTLTSTPFRNKVFSATLPEKWELCSEKKKCGIEIHGFDSDAARSSVSPSSHKKKHKKGGLSMFLSGALDHPEEAAPPPQKPLSLPKVESPAWGGAKKSNESSSLREIQCQQIAETISVPAESSSSARSDFMPTMNRRIVRGKSKGILDFEELSRSPDFGVARYSLDQFIRTSTPIAVMPVKSVKAAASGNPDSSPTPWAGTSPLASTSSFKDIQMEQVKGKQQQKYNIKQTVSSVSDQNTLLTNTSSAEKVDEQTPSRWFKPDTQSPSSIRCIQIEEQAIKEIRRMYKNVKVVRSGNL